MDRGTVVPVDEPGRDAAELAPVRAVFTFPATRVSAWQATRARRDQWRRSEMRLFLIS